MIGRLIERLFVSVRADMSDLSRDLSQGMAQTRTATNSMAMSWDQVSAKVDELTRSLNQHKITQGRYTSEMNRLSSAMRSVAGGYREAQREVWKYASAAQAAQRATALAVNTRPLRAFTRSAGQARMQLMNLGYQLNDIGMTLATGMNPMTVMIQQGSQIAQIYGGQGGVRQAFKDITQLLVGLGKRLWPIAVIAGGFAMLTREINKTGDTAVSFMDTTKAVFQVISRYIWSLIDGPVNYLKGAFETVLDFIAEWFPKVMNGVIGTAVSAVKIIGASWELLPDLWHDAWTAIKNTTIDVSSFIIDIFKVHLPKWVSWGANILVQSLVAGFRSVKAVWSQLPAIMSDAIGGAVNSVVVGVERLVNAAVAGINKLIAGLQAVMDFVGADKAFELFGFSGTLPELQQADLAQWKVETGNALKDTAELVATEVGRTFNETFIDEINNNGFTGLDGYKGAYRTAFGELGRQIEGILSESMNFDYMGQFFEDIKSQAIDNALRRIAEGMEDVKGAAERAAKEVKTLLEQMKEGLEKAADNLAQVFGNAFERLAETGRFTFGDFIRDLNRLIIRSTSELLQQELSNMLQTLATSKGGLGSLISKIFTSILGGGNFLGFRARGGVEMPWRNFIAGEEGAEIISQDGPAGARRVKTAGQTRHLMQRQGYAGPNVTMIIQTPDVESFRKSQLQIASKMGMFISRGQRNQ
jgi:methyl-accepting chemotaxis protein